VSQPAGAAFGVATFTGGGSVAPGDNQDAKSVASPTATPKTAATRPRPGRRKRARSAVLAALATLPVKGRASKTGYDREQFGGDWASVNGCDTRDGAQQWPYRRRVRFANDPLNLLAVDGSANRQKGDGDAATWLPPNKSFRCAYVARQIAVKERYDAWITAAEHDAMQHVLISCSHVRTRQAPSLDGRYFANCDAVRAAGRAPLLRGDPAYAANPQLDRDKDGVACES
jgi:hypothetical protein